jgi:thermitase
MVGDRRRDWFSFGRGKRRRASKSRCRSRLAQIVETLEGRTMLSAASIDVHQVLWNGALMEAVRDEYVLRMPQLNATRATAVNDFASRTPRTPDGWEIDSLGMGFYKLTAPGASEQIVTAWAQRQLVRYIEPNAVRHAAAAPNDPLYSDAPNWGFDRIDAERAWDASTGSTATVVAVLDTGIDYNHPDLVGNMWRDPDTGVFGFNAVARNFDPMDDNGHGTFAAGLIGAVGDNSIGLAGVNWTTQLMAVKVLDSAGVGTAAQVIRGVNYVIDRKIAGQSISTVHCGFARTDFSQGEFEALQLLGATGVVIVCAAGNDSNNNDIFPRYPANYQIPTLISVAASTRTDSLAPFSNFGPRTVHLAAPGVGVLSTRAAQANTPPFTPYQGNGNYTVHSGTSFSSAFVAGAAALLKVIKPTASAGQIRSAILDGVDQVPALAPFVATGGRLNLANSVDLILSTVGTVPVASFKPGQVTRVVEGDYGYTFLTITVVLDRPPDPGKTAVVAYETRPGGSAFENVDFVAQRGLLTFSGHQTEQSFRLRIIGDRIPEPDEQFAVRLVQARSRDVEIGTPQINITIVDDDFNEAPVVPAPSDALVPSVRITPLTDSNGDVIRVQEGDTAQFVIYLDRVSDKPITVRYRTHEPAVKPIEFATAGRDYVSTQGTVTFRPGETRKIISVKTLADNELEVINPATGLPVRDGDGNPIPEIFNVSLYDPINAVLAGNESLAVGQIFDVAPLPPAPPPSAGGFTIAVQFTTPDAFTTTQIDAFARATTRWEQIIVGDLPSVVDPSTGRLIDDILIEVSARPIDGPGGVLGAAGPTELRAGPNGLPWKGIMLFDTADLTTLERGGELVDVIIHEMGHALGFGSLWARRGLVAGGGTDTPTFVGANAVREYNSIFGVSAAGVPLEATGGQGTAESHWSKDVFGAELMTGFLSPGVTRPISRVTVGQFADLGYQVNYAAADPLTPPLRAAAVGRPLPIRLPSALPAPEAPPAASQPIGGLPLTPLPSEPVVVRPPINSPPVVAPLPAPGVRTPITRVPVTRVAVSTQPVSVSSVVRQPVTAR